MKILLTYPETPVSYWGFQHALALDGRRGAFPPLGLLTVAALLPQEWEFRLADGNTKPITDDAIAWADAVLVGGMRIEMSRMHELLRRARRLGKRTVAGGPAVSTSPDDFGDADIVFQGELEGRVHELVEALQGPGGPVRLCAPAQRPDITATPPPRDDLGDRGDYAPSTASSATSSSSSVASRG
jgi:radical SAM superfamily enzyme YgiQ (UPF0313 family)